MDGYSYDVDPRPLVPNFVIEALVEFLEEKGVTQEMRSARDPEQYTEDAKRALITMQRVAPDTFKALTEQLENLRYWVYGDEIGD
jgi:hypothetical protein